MNKTFKNQSFAFEDGTEIYIDVVAEDDEVKEVIAAELFEYKGFKFNVGDGINVNGDESLIRSENVQISFLED